MSAIRFVVICALAVFCFSQLVLSKPDQPAAAPSGIEDLQVKMQANIDYLRNAMGDLFKNMSSAIESEIQKNPGAAQLYKNVTDTFNSMAKQMKDSIGKP